MLIPGRHEASGSYRYGFQGQEKDDEIKGEGNSLNYTFRMHDPRVGRFFAVDPLTAKYPWYTPYSFSGNKVINSVELEGKEEATVIQYDPRADESKPVFTENAGTILDRVNNAASNTQALLYNSFYLPVKNGIASAVNFTNNLINGDYNNISGADIITPKINSVEDYLAFTTKYISETPIKQQFKDALNDLSNLETWELPLQLIVFHKVSNTTSTARIARNDLVVTSEMSLTEQIQTRKKLAKSFYEKSGFSEESAIDHMGGIKFENPVYTTYLEEGTVVQQWVGEKGVGNYFTTKRNGTTQNLGLNTYDNRTLEQFIITKRTKVLSSICSDLDNTVGGGRQYFSTELKNNIKPVSTNP